MNKCTKVELDTNKQQLSRKGLVRLKKNNLTWDVMTILEARKHRYLSQVPEFPLIPGLFRFFRNQVPDTRGTGFTGFPWVPDSSMRVYWYLWAAYTLILVQICPMINIICFWNVVELDQVKYLNGLTELVQVNHAWSANDLHMDKCDSVTWLIGISALIWLAQVV